MAKGDFHHVLELIEVEFMQHAVGSCHVEVHAIDGHIRGDGGCAAVERNCRRYGFCVEAVDQDSQIAGDDEDLSGIGRDEEVDGVECALPNIDVDRFKGHVQCGVADDDRLRTNRAEGRVGRSLGGSSGDDIDASVIDAEEKVEALRFQNLRNGCVAHGDVASHRSLSWSR